jgi:hypothetical protein
MMRVGPKRRRPRVKRSSIALDASDYARLQALAEKHRPPLSVRYVIEYAVVRFLDSAQLAGSIDIAALRPPKR